MAVISSFYDVHNRNFSSNYLLKFWRTRDKIFEEKFKDFFEDKRRLFCLKYFDEQLYNFLKITKIYSRTTLLSLQAITVRYFITASHHLIPLL